MLRYITNIIAFMLCGNHVNATSTEVIVRIKNNGGSLPERLCPRGMLVKTLKNTMKSSTLRTRDNTILEDDKTIGDYAQNSDLLELIENVTP